jgi:endoribonuclease Dicer
MVGYVQSRGRARHKSSTFIVMVQEGQQESISKYLAFQNTEPELKRFYQHQATTQPIIDEELEEGELEPDDPRDIAERERYVVPSTKATLTYHSCIGLLNHLCSLVPRDRFTPPQIPMYSGDFQCVLKLPSSLPLPPQYLMFQGPLRQSKKEAKRSVAFLAVKTLHGIGVFDDYLLPTKSARDAEAEDAEGRIINDWGHIPDLMTANIRDPWTVDEKLWMHIVYTNGKPVAGLVTGTQLPEADLVWNTDAIQTGRPTRVVLEADSRQREIMQTYTRVGVWWSVTGRGVKLPLACYLVPLASTSLKPDWDAMEATAAYPWGSGDWSSIGEQHHDRLLCMNAKEFGRPLILRRVRYDLTPMSQPPPGFSEQNHSTYRDFWIEKYTRKGVPPEITEHGPVVEMSPVVRNLSGEYAMDPDPQATRTAEPVTSKNGELAPVCIARWVALSLDMWTVFKVLPRLLHRVTDLYRVQAARHELYLPPMPSNLLIEAYTLPSVAAQHNNQRLETLGDAVLKLGIVVHLYNRFPHRHEGQLDVLRRSSVSNKTLLSRACDIDLARFVSAETSTMRTWRYVLDEETDWQHEPRPNRYVARSVARNSMQDCMESSLGAAYTMGGIDYALRVATALGLAMGGPLPWPLRYGRKPEPSMKSALFQELQEADLGYQFHREELLLEALTHPSFKTDVSSSYQRLEFLGDGEFCQIQLRSC